MIFLSIRKVKLGNKIQQDIQQDKTPKVHNSNLI